MVRVLQLHLSFWMRLAQSLGVPCLFITTFLLVRLAARFTRDRRKRNERAHDKPDTDYTTIHVHTLHLLTSLSISRIHPCLTSCHKDPNEVAKRIKCSKSFSPLRSFDPQTPSPEPQSPNPTP